MQKNRCHDWLSSPIFIFLLIWSLQIVGILAYSEDFYPFSDMTWWLTAIGITSFCFGTLLVSLVKVKKRTIDNIDISRRVAAIKLTFLIFLPIYLIGALFPAIWDFFINSHGSLGEMRDLIIDGVNSRDTSSIISLYLNYLAALFSIYFISYSKYFSKKILIIVCCIGFIACIFTLGRNILLLFFSASTISFYLQGRLKVKSLVIIGSVFLILFFLIAILLKKGDSGDGILQIISWNLQVYFLNGLACFNHFVMFQDPQIPGGILLPNIIRRIFDPYVYGGLTMAPTFYPFVETPLPGNVYTALYPWYHDGGILGVIFGFFMMGFLSQYLYVKRKKSGVYLYLYSISVYSLLMTIFEEQYLRAYPLWILILAIPAISKFAEIFGRRKINMLRMKS